MIRQRWLSRPRSVTFAMAAAGLMLLPGCSGSTDPSADPADIGDVVADSSADGDVDEDSNDAVDATRPDTVDASEDTAPDAVDVQTDVDNDVQADVPEDAVETDTVDDAAADASTGDTASDVVDDTDSVADADAAADVVDAAADVADADAPDVPDAGPSSDADALADADVTERLVLGAPCESSDECASGECSAFGDSESLCTESCTETCATEGFECFAGFCLPEDFCAADVNFGPACLDACGGCGESAICVADVDAEAFCVCVSGYEGDGITCTDVDECALDNGGCGSADFVTCINRDGDTPLCEDINECELDNGGCGPAGFVTCTNIYGAAAECDDVLECAADNGGCPVDVTTCIERFAAPPQCEDVLECAVDNGGCGDERFTRCVEQEAAEPVCEDINECLVDNGGCGAEGFVTCINIDGAEPLCEDVLECAVDNGGCGPDGFIVCGERFGAAPTCEDIRECAVDNGGCEPGFETCVEQVAAAPVCLDINECDADNGGCGPELLYECVNNSAAPPSCLPLFLPGALDPLFGEGGFAALPDPGDLSERIWDAAYSPADARIYLAGASRVGAVGAPECLVMATTVDGGADDGFGVGGRFTSVPVAQGNCQLRAIDVALDGRIGVGGNAGDLIAVGSVSGGSASITTIGGPAGSGSLASRAVSWSDAGALVHAVDSFVAGIGNRVAQVASSTASGEVVPGFGVVGFSPLGVLDGAATVVNASVRLDSDTMLVAGTNEHLDGAHTAFIAAVNASTGALEPSFGTGGVAVFAVPDVACRFTSVVVGDGFIYAAGSMGFGLDEDVLVARFGFDGSEADFDAEPGYFRGPLVGRDIAYDLTIDTEGRLLLTGEYDLSGLAQPAVIRLLASGDIDLSFGLSTFGRSEFADQEAEGWAIDVLPDGKILVAGRARDLTTGVDRPFLARLLP